MKKKEYYNLAEVEQMVDLKTRAVKYRMLKVKEKYKENKKLLFKSKRDWNIHHSIIFEFDRIQLTNEEKKKKYTSLVTVSPFGNYDIQSLDEVMKQIHKDLSHLQADVRIHYFIEEGEKGKLNHIHFATNLTPNHKNLIHRVANYYILANTDVRPIYEVRQLYDYLLKDCKKQGFLGLYNGKLVPSEPTSTPGNDMHALVNQIIKLRITG